MLEDDHLTQAVRFSFQGEGDAKIHAQKWLPAPEDTTALVIINHAKAEHIARYDPIASFLQSRGFAVYGEYHRGHGLTAGSSDNLGFFDDHQGWMKVLGDIRRLHLLAQREHKGLPVFFLGHSMGSFLTCHYLSLYGNELAGAILSGTGSHSQILLAVAQGVARMEAGMKGKKHTSTLLDKLIFGSFNKSFASEGTSGFEWLSRDAQSVQAYVADPLCGFICSCGFFFDLFEGLKVVNKSACFQNTPSELPILLYAGTDDPVGNEGKAVKGVAQSYKAGGTRDLTLILREGFRHECLNDLERESVFKDIYEWLVARIPG